MKKVIALVLVLMCLATATAVAEGKLKVTEKNLIVYAGDDTGYFFAKVENVGDRTVGVDSGDLVIFSEDDEILCTEQYVTTIPYYVSLQPGDYMYIGEYLWKSELENAAIGDYKFSVQIGRDSWSTIQIFPCEASFDFEGVSSYDNYVYVTLKNMLDEPMYDVYIVAALYDKNDNLVYVDSVNMNSMALYPDSTVTGRIYVDNDIMKYYDQNDIVPARVEATAYYLEAFE